MEFQYRCFWELLLRVRDEVLCCLLSYVSAARRDDTETRPLASHFRVGIRTMIICTLKSWAPPGDLYDIQTEPPLLCWLLSLAKTKWLCWNLSSDNHLRYKNISTISKTGSADLDMKELLNCLQLKWASMIFLSKPDQATLNLVRIGLLVETS